MATSALSIVLQVLLEDVFVEPSIGSLRSDLEHQTFMEVKRKRDLVSSLIWEAERDIVDVCKGIEGKCKEASLEAEGMEGKCKKRKRDLVSLEAEGMEGKCKKRKRDLVSLEAEGIEGKCKEASIEAEGIEGKCKKRKRDLVSFSKSKKEFSKYMFPLMRIGVRGRWSSLDILFLLSNWENLFIDQDPIMEHTIYQWLEKSTDWWKTPDYKSIVNRIEKARGKATNYVHYPVLFLVSAAIKEMEDLQVENLDWETLEKWGATLNDAKEIGFQVAFADNLLKTNLLAYLAYSTMVG